MRFIGSPLVKGSRLASGLYLDLGRHVSVSRLRSWNLFIYHLCVRRQDCYMGDIGGAAQAGASVADTAMTDALNMYEASQNREFSHNEAVLARQFDAHQQGVAQQFSAQQASLNREFQDAEQRKAEAYNTQMSDTAMQRRAADLRQAGFNPLLAIAQGGASAPQMSGLSGSSASGSPLGGPAAQASGLPNIQPLMSGLAGVQAARQQSAQADLTDAQTRGQNLQNAKTNAELPYAAAQADATVANLDAQRQNLLAQAKALGAQYDYSEANAAKLLQDRDFARQLQPLVVKAAELSNQAKQYGMPELSTQSDFWSGPLAAGAYAGQQGEKVGIGGGYFATFLEALRRSANQPVPPSGFPDIGNPSP